MDDWVWVVRCCSWDTPDPADPRFFISDKLLFSSPRLVLTSGVVRDARL